MKSMVLDFLFELIAVLLNFRDIGCLIGKLSRISIPDPLKFQFATVREKFSTSGYEILTSSERVFIMASQNSLI